MLDRNGNLWIRLTIAGVTRIGVGDGSSLKEIVGDAVRNAAMRFGVALDLWTKDELESGHAEVKPEVAPVASPTDRIWSHASGPTDDAKREWVTAQFDARGLSKENPADRMKLADELDGVVS